MIPISNVLAFAVTAMVIVAIPGPSVLFTISRALTVGRQAALLTVLGNAVGVYLQVVPAAFGMGVAVEHSAFAFTTVKYVGAAYIAFLGVQAIRHRKSFTESLGQRITPVAPLRALRDGVIVGVTNPKTIVVFVAVMPGFVEPGIGHLPVQLLLLGALFPASGLVLDSTWALAAGAARNWFARSPQRMAAIGGAGGLVMIGLGASLVLTGRKD